MLYILFKESHLYYLMEYNLMNLHHSKLFNTFYFNPNELQISVQKLNKIVNSIMTIQKSKLETQWQHYPPRHAIAEDDGATSIRGDSLWACACPGLRRGSLCLFPSGRGRGSALGRTSPWWRLRWWWDWFLSSRPRTRMFLIISSIGWWFVCALVHFIFSCEIQFIDLLVLVSPCWDS